MREYINIGAAPPDEDCAQLGSDNYYEQSRIECNRYIKKLREWFGPEPEGAELRIKSFQHDFGSYIEVVCYYDEDKPKSVDYAFNCESGGPKTWDDVK